MSLGTKIKALRKERKWSAEYLAERSGVTQSTISDIESEKRSPQLETLEKIAIGFDIPLIEILPINDYFSHSDSALSTYELKIIELCHQISPEHRNIIISILETFINDKTNVLINLVDSIIKSKNQ